MLILLAEDDPKISKLLIHLLKKDGFQTDWASDGLEALDFTSMNSYDIIILDWMMPEMSGIEVCSRLRESGCNSGIIMLTAKDSLDDKINGLNTGADDYLVKPFEYKELLARINSLSRRSKKPLAEDLVTLGNLTVDRTSKSVSINGESIPLSRREYQLFNLLMENRGRTVPREVILDKVWGTSSEVSENNLDAFIRLLRKKIEKSGSKRILVNVRGIGYRLEV